MTREGIKADGLSVLHEPTPAAEVKQRQGPRKHAGDCPKFGTCPQPHMMLDYVDARYVMDKLDHLGPENWQDRYIDRPGGSVRCGIGLLVDGEWVWKWDVGTISDIEPEKGSYSEAFKRAAVKWGVGRDLYGHKPAAPAAPVRPVAPPAARPAPGQPGFPDGRQFVNAPVDPLAGARAIFDEPPMPMPPGEEAPLSPQITRASEINVALGGADFAPQRIIPPAPHGGWSEGQVHTPGHKGLRARQNGHLFCPTRLPDGGWCAFRTDAPA